MRCVLTCGMVGWIFTSLCTFVRHHGSRTFKASLRFLGLILIDQELGREAESEK